MKKLRIAMASLGTLGLMFVYGGGVALADESEISNTGPDSTNTITHSGDTNYTWTNNNSTSVNNDVDQDATSGDATVDGNTEAGNATTGDASNESTVATTISIDNSAPGGSAGPGGPGGGVVVNPPLSSGTGGPTGTGGQALSSGTGGPTGTGGQALSSGTGGALPVTGPTSPIDVSGLRDLYQPGSDLANKTRGVSAGLLAAAALLSLLGAAGSAIYTKKNEA